MSTQKSSVLISLVIVALFVWCVSKSRAGDATLKVTLRIQAHKRSPHQIPKYITGKFCEHLGFNIYHGMDAQILHNPTLAEYPFCVPGTSPDGVAKFHSNHDEIEKLIRQGAPSFGWPQETIADMSSDWRGGLACWWTLEGKREDVRVSPDVRGPRHRAQRVEVKAAGQGIAQWTYLPLHRVRKYEFELIARSPDMSSLTVSLGGPRRGKADAKAKVKGLSDEWKTFTGSLELKGDITTDASYKFAITADAAGQFLIERVLLRPAAVAVMPRGFPRIFPYWQEPSASQDSKGDHLKLRELAALQISLGQRLFSEDTDGPHAIEVESITLEKSDSK